MATPKSPGQVLPPWVESPFRLWSWLDMNKFSAAIFVNIGSSLHWFSTLVETGEWKDSIKEIGERFGKGVAENLKEIGCDVSAQAAVRFADELPGRSSAYPVTDIKPRARELQSMIFDEMRKHLFFWVPPERARFYQLPEHHEKWDDTQKAIAGPISTFFKKAANEILSARSAYAVGQYTPCVFHLMRACEVGIKALYKSLGIATPSLSDSWGNMLKPMDKQLAMKPDDRQGDWAIHPEFFDQTTNDIRAIKRVWRDTTMHIEFDYNGGEALRVLDAVTSFFVHLSEKLDQDGTVH